MYSHKATNIFLVNKTCVDVTHVIFSCQSHNLNSTFTLSNYELRFTLNRFVIYLNKISRKHKRYFEPKQYYNNQKIGKIIVINIYKKENYTERDKSKCLNCWFSI